MNNIYLQKEGYGVNYKDPIKNQKYYKIIGRMKIYMEFPYLVRNSIYGLLVLSICCCNISKKNVLDDCPNYYDKTLKRTVYTSVNEMPIFPIGQSFNSYLQQNLAYKCDKDQLLLDLDFYVIVDTNGYIVKFKMDETNQYNNMYMEEDIKNLIKNSPKWIPGKCDSIAVPVRIDILIKY